jgi:hypothetical protein
MSKVFLHIGMHKTATTWFQRQLFPKIGGACVIRRKKMHEIAESLNAHGDAAIIIVSHEGLGGSVSWERTPGETIARLSQNLSALMTLRPDASVIVGYREQSGWLASAFAQRAKKSWGVTWDRYLLRFSLEELCWCNGLRLVESLCPSVFPFLYEELVEAPEILVEDLCRFIGSPPPSDVQELLRIRENPSPRSRLGQTLSAMCRPALGWVGRSASRRLKAGLRNFDSRYSPRRIQLPGAWEARLRQDWDQLLALVSERRGRDLSRLRVIETAPLIEVLSVQPR